MVSQHSSPKKLENLGFSKVFAHGLAWPGTAQAQARSRPGPGPSRKLESWKTITKVGNSWKFLEIHGKLKVFQLFWAKKLENLWFSNIFLLPWPVHVQARLRQSKLAFRVMGTVAW